jgi:integrase
VRQAGERHAAGDRWQNSDLVFASKFGGPADPVAFNRAWKALAKDVLGDSVHFVPHGARRTMGTLRAEAMMAQLGRPLTLTEWAQIGDELGHADGRVTMLAYGNPSPEARQTARLANARALPAVY